ncbi:MAG: hypothetical protein COS41_02345 [Elusimicrobia bacterium CG03_land_8_20_14_0_80_50_18]|nr:MAG: hypothetical protein COS41_02345 [Elusimicrobia bacterium CG03_land_8_20_14_0_80_50_18]PIX16139.1 MAG: hypothetical protein COZ72_01755 [Elusimicrobia bacterium CG_4_8_14_3_um_filter_50_9]
MTETIILFLLALMILGSLIALESKDILSSVIAMGAVGFMLSAIFLILRAPDIAMVQVVIEILTLIILIRATISRDVHTVTDTRDFLPLALNMVLLFVFFIIAAEAIRNMPDFGTGLSKVAGHYLNRGLNDTGSANIVTSVILDYRAYDTLGEATVLFAALIGAITILRRKAKND